MNNEDLIMYPLVFFTTGIWVWNAMNWLIIKGVL